ncbi:hypothetical protein ACFL6U_20150 [Planctomycetota bacterium]
MKLSILTVAHLILGVCLLLGVYGCSERTESGQVPSLPAGPNDPALAFITPDANAFAPAQADQIVFDMRYRGLNGDEEDLRYGGFYGFGGKTDDTAFIRDLRKHGIRDVQLIYNPEFKDAETSAIEVRGGEAVAFYLDLNADGKVTDNERIEPLVQQDEEYTFFVTPDFSFTNRDKKQVTFRALLRARPSSGQRDFYCYWSPTCILEGQALLEGQPAQLFLYSAGFTGAFDRFGWSDVALRIGTDSQDNRLRRSDLSRLIYLEDQYYRLALLRSDQHPTALRVVLAPDISPRGTVVLKFEGPENMRSETSWARVNGAEETDDISLALNTDVLPVGSYKLEGAGLRYGTEETPKAWTLDFDKGPVFTVKADEETVVTLGKPQLSIQAVEYNYRYRANPTTETRFKKGTQIYLTRHVTGMANEAYGRFQKKQSGSHDVCPQIAIQGPKGKEILSQELEYG